MCLKLDACGIDINLKIKGYTTSTKDNWDYQWCRCDFSFSSGDWLNYQREDNEVLLCCEVEELETYFTKLLNDELSAVKKITCLEPDFVFVLHPQFNKRKNSQYADVNYEKEEDIYVEWKVFFWSGGITDNHLTVILDRNDIMVMRDYLLHIIEN